MGPVDYVTWGLQIHIGKGQVFEGTCTDPLFVSGAIWLEFSRDAGCIQKAWWGQGVEYEKGYPSSSAERSGEGHNPLPSKNAIFT